MNTTSDRAMTLQPRPTAGPFTAATTGIRQRIMLMTSSRPSAMTSWRKTRSLAIRSSRSKSPPAENARPAPPVVDSVEALGQPSAHVQPQHLGLDVGPRHRVPLVGPEGRRIGPQLVLELLDRLGVPRHVAQFARLSLVADDRHGDAPPLARLADHVVGG